MQAPPLTINTIVKHCLAELTELNQLHHDVQTTELDRGEELRKRIAETLIDDKNPHTVLLDSFNQQTGYVGSLSNDLNRALANLQSEKNPAEALASILAKPLTEEGNDPLDVLASLTQTLDKIVTLKIKFNEKFPDLASNMQSPGSDGLFMGMSVGLARELLNRITQHFSDANKILLTAALKIFHTIVDAKI